MAKLEEKDIPIVVSLLQEGERFGEIAEALEVSSPTLRKFMLENDLYKFSTNKNSLNISKSQSKSNDDNTLKSIIEDVLDHENDLYQEDINFLEELLKKGTSIGKISRMYHRGRGTVREYLKNIGLYQKYCADNKFENGAARKHLNRIEKAKENEETQEIKVNAVISRPKNGKVATKPQMEITTENQSKKEETSKEVINNTKSEDATVGEQKIPNVFDFSNSNCVVNDVVLNYINKNMKKISMDARLEDLSNILMDKLISNFSEEELKEPEIKLNIKKTLIKIVEELL